MLAEARGWFCDHGRVARPTVVLNVNYPALPVADARGVRVARQGSTTDLHLAFEPSGEGEYASRRVREAAKPDAPDSDVALLGQGYVTVTPIAARLDGRDLPLRDLQRRLRN
jgi:broad specificity polyphosphatase/5'/3'-nucleotidase SurE